MSKTKIGVIPGDGIGPEITASTMRILEATGLEAEWVYLDAGLSAIEKGKGSMPQETIDTIREIGIALKGPTTTPSGGGHSSANVALRRALDLFANVRPAKTLPGLSGPFANMKLDMIIVRENTEGLYSGIEFQPHPDMAQAVKVMTRPGCARLVKYGFEMAREQKRKRVTAVHKANIMKFSDGLFLEVARRVAERHPDVEFEDRIIDNLCNQLVSRPEEYDVVVLPNLYGDILSDAAAALVGGLGFAPSGCYGDAYDLYAHYKHGGDHKAAYRALGAERRIASGNVVYPEQFADPPAWINEIPPHDEMPDFAEATFEPDFDPAIEAPTELQVVDAFDFDESAIPTRPWVIPGVMLSGYTHMLAAPGGSGKSLFTLQLAITLALGEPWGSFHPRRKARTLVINVEDDLHEQRRRLAAARRVMGPEQDALRGMVHLVADTDNIIVAGFDEHRRVMVAKPIVPVLVDYIRRNQIDVLIVDPFTETFEGDENDNSEVKWAMRIWRDEIAKATGCAVYLVHHTTKYAAGGAGDANVVRGAGAIVNSTRISATLMPMTQDEAATLGIDEGERNLYVRYDDAKANQSLKSGKARWFQKQSVTLTNGDENHPADEVGALIPWSPPGMLDGISIHAINAALDSIDGGIVDAHGVPTGSRYTYSTKGGTKESGRWAGCVLINQLGMKEGQAGALLKTWMKNGVVVEDTYRDPNRRKDISGLFAPRSARPGEAF